MMIPEWCHVRYRVLQPCGVCGHDVDVRLEPGGGTCGDDAQVVFAWEGDVLEVRLTAQADVRVELCRIELHRAFYAFDRIVMNGYQSWTDTVEMTPSSVMRGLKRASRRTVRKYVLDGSGDYAFASYPETPGRFHGFTYMTVRNGDDYELLGSLDESDGFTQMKVDVAMESVQVERECSACVLHAGETRVLCGLALVRGGCDQVYDRWFQLSGVRALQAPPLVGYTSWYRRYGDIGEEALLADLRGAQDAFSQFDCKGLTKVFQVDDGYCSVGDWTVPHVDRFPNGLAPLAAAIADAGFVPGIWVAPFVCERQSRIGRERPEWLLRDAQGNAVKAGSHWSGSYALDTLNPDVRRHVRESLRTLTVDWGFRLLKVDFMYAACMLPHGGMNRGELMADAVDLVRQAVGPDVALLACGVPLGSVFGKVEYCRIGCDVGLDWDDKPPMRLLHRERVSTRNSLANTVFRAPLNGRAFANDPDVCFLRNDVKLSASQKEALISADACHGGMLLTSDDMGAWNAGQRALYQAAIDVLRDRTAG